MRVYVPSAVITYPRPRGANRVIWVGPPSDAEHWIAFTILMSDATLSSIVGVTLLGALRLRDGRTISVVSEEIAGEASEHTFSVPPDEIDDLRRRVALRGARMIIVGQSGADGCTGFLELVAFPREG
jgi:hypothetical protein